MNRAIARPLVGLATVVGIVAVVALATVLFRGGFANSASTPVEAVAVNRCHMSFIDSLSCSGYVGVG